MTVIYEPGDQHLRVELANGTAISIDGVSDEERFELGGDPQATRALWLPKPEAVVLGQMIDYVLEKVKIKDESKAALEQIKAQLAELYE